MSKHFGTEPLTREAWFAPRLKLLGRFALFALLSPPALLAISIVHDDAWRVFFLLVAFVSLTPLLFWICFIPVLHWRDRYIGAHPYTWGAFLVFENSGWTKIIFWIAHVLKDKNRSGRYALLD